MNIKNTISRTFYNAAIREAESCIGADAGDLNTELYTEFARNGNRVHYEAVNFRRRRLLNRLALGELCEGKGRFLPEINRLIDCTLKEPTWVLPAHSGGILPVREESNIDLFSSQTAAALAMISARLPLGEALQKRIWETIDARILKPFLKHDYWWRDLGENRRKVPSNWTPWCIHGVLECVRAVLPNALPWCNDILVDGESDGKTQQTESRKIPQINPAAPAFWQTQSLACFLPPKSLAQQTEIAQSCLSSLQNYFEDYPDDGGCDEGAQYWEHSVGHFFECGIWNLFPISKLCNMYSFIYKVHMTGSYYMNFADCAARITPNASMIFLMGKAANLPELAHFGAFLFHEAMEEAPDPTLKDNMDFRALLNAGIASAPLETCDGKFTHRQYDLFESLSAGIFRREHFLAAAKGGHNGENHNHNDCGNVIVYADGKPILIDAGVGAYTKETFSDRRYSIWTMQSSYHNLPEINGYMQKDGKEFAAESTTFMEDSFLCICHNAYPPESGLLRFSRAVNVGEKFVKLTSEFSFAKSSFGDGANHITLNYMLAKKPELKICRARVNGCLIKLPRGNWSVETVEFGEDEKLSPVWGHCVYRLRGEIKIPANRYTAVTIIERDKEKAEPEKKKKLNYTVIGEPPKNSMSKENKTGASIHIPSAIYKPFASPADLYFMEEAIKQANLAVMAGDVPIGCVITHGEEIIARAYNRRNQDASVLAHAEILAIEKAAKKCRDFRLEDCTLYVTLEPCPMCAGAIVQARIPHVVIGAMNPKAGCAGSVLNILQNTGFNHQSKITTGVCRKECSALLRDFFKELREEGES
ncbi:MAG: tRNA adenosine(34) deaminase TadA [Lachnospiraceae bacterium]|nr:tRNA adenosine(34) deaminase TadA [Lachnospiraceae bacterium]